MKIYVGRKFYETDDMTAKELKQLKKNYSSVTKALKDGKKENDKESDK